MLMASNNTTNESSWPSSTLSIESSDHGAVLDLEEPDPIENDV